MSEMNVTVIFACKDKAYQNEIRDVFDIVVINGRHDYLGLGTLNDEQTYDEFWGRLELIMDRAEPYDYIEEYYRGLETMSATDEFVQLNYVTGRFGEEFAEEMRRYFTDMEVDELQIDCSELI